MNSKNADYRAILGFAFELLGNMKEARREWAEAEKLDPRVGEGIEQCISH